MTDRVDDILILLLIGGLTAPLFAVAIAMVVAAFTGKACPA